ncbi:DUF2829 domain-containing protein [Methylobacterium terricola]|uniref:DUF2829 domain-containing protein n=1 Tax=Methylobacterium terricola TaxID=2583531 RepID=A0A5C4LLV5_9HYPH|nr:DUF2829 domain-containing protein [Methylobacterium terricola]TNC14945.1 DUF2829 domain-containing protein [Methylobacterium terricola]
MNIGEAVAALKAGDWVRRAGWNGKRMHIYMEDAEDVGMPRHNTKTDKVTMSPGRRHEPYLVLFTAAGTHQPGWNASTPDLLAEDWEVVPLNERH